MKSKANIKSHPIHPMLIPFPIGFFFGCFIFHVVSTFNGNATVWTMGNYLGILGVFSALLAAVPGILDYVYVVPSKSSAKQRAARHGLINSSVVVLFIVSMLSAWEGPYDRAWLCLLMELCGVVLLTIGGWLGGTLVYRNQIAVDHRYADAGKWQEVFIKEDQGDKIIINDPETLKINQMRLIRYKDQRIVVGRREEGLVAFEDRCAHKGGSLADGVMICGTIQCPWHGSQFDAASGNIKAGPATKKIQYYPVESMKGISYVLLR